MSKVVVGDFGAAHGFKGWIRVNSYTELDADIFNFKPWLIAKDNNNFSSLKILDWKNHFKKKIVLLEGYDSDLSVKTLVNSKIYICRSNLKDLNDEGYYWSDLIGCSVFNKRGVSIGLVSDLFNNTAHDILVVKNDLVNDSDNSECSEILIPFIYDSIVFSVNLDSKKIIVDWENDF